MDKKSIRKSLLELRKNIKEEQRFVLDKSIFDLLVNSNLYKEAKSIFIYVSCKDEVDTKKVIKHSLNSGKSVYVPKTYIKEKVMNAIKINSLDELIVNNYGIFEPKAVYKSNIGIDFDIIIMPGLAFDKIGNRIGYGGGYYDKYISKLNYKVLKIALAYDFQILDNIDFEEHDIRVDYIITNKQLITI